MKTAPQDSVFAQRIDALCRLNKLSRTALGVAAGRSPETVRNWIGKAEEGKLRRSDELHAFCKHYGTTIEWLLGETESGAPAGLHDVANDLSARAPIQVSPTVDAHAMMSKAVDMLVELDGMKRADAALKVIDVRLSGPPSDLAYYRAARLGEHRVATPEDFEEPQPAPKGRGRR